MNRTFISPKTNRKYDVRPITDLCNMKSGLWCGIFDDTQLGKCFVKAMSYGSLSPSDQRLFDDAAAAEAAAMGQAADCHISSPLLYDHWNDPICKEYILVMQRMEGVTLARWLKKRNRTRPVDQTELFIRCQILRSLCIQLQKLEKRQMALVHRDLKPENIFISLNSKTKRWETSIIDFGCTRLNHIRNTGTPNYQAPEQRGFKFCDVRISSKTDIFSLGLILFEMLEGHVPSTDKDYKLSRSVMSNWVEQPSLPENILSLAGGDTLDLLQKKMTRLHSAQRPTYQEIIYQLGTIPKKI